MGDTLQLAAIGAVAFMVLDGIWLGLLYDFTNYSTLRQWPSVLTRVPL